jgi:hypothetical protein
MAKWSVIPCAEVHNTRREWLDADGRFRASVQLECEWEDRFKLVCDLYTSRYGATLPSDTTGYCPREYPHIASSTADGGISAPRMDRIGVDSAQISTIPECYTTDDSETIRYKNVARIDVQYGRHYNIQDSIEWDIQAIMQTYQQFKWVTPLVTGDLETLGEMEAPVHTYSTAILTRDFIGLTPLGLTGPMSPDFTTLIDCVNHLNTTAYTSGQLGKTFKTGTLLMLEPETRLSTDMQNSGSNNEFGGQGVSVKVRFLYKPGEAASPNGPDTSIDTHNRFWRARMKRADGKRGGWDRLLVKDPYSTTLDNFDPFKYNADISLHWLKQAKVPTTPQ